MRQTMAIRYLLFSAIFALVLVGLIVKSYPLLVGLVIVAIVVGLVADKIDNAPTEPFKGHNQLHHRSH